MHQIARTPPRGARMAIAAGAALALSLSAAAAAADAAPAPDKGDVAWMMVSTLLVLLMILPGLALFYGGLVRAKNMVSMLSQVTAVTAIGVLMWVAVGYSIAFSDGGRFDPVFGGVSRAFLAGVTPSSLAATFSTGVYIPEYAFVMFQATFACITAALVLGGVAERKKFSAVVLFSILWPLVVYYPMAHMVWWWPGPDAIAAAPEAPVRAGLIWSFGALDFAGGTVVHINAGFAALIGALILGKRRGYRKEPMPPHSLTLTLVGAGLLWVGWFGFNAGSNLEANGYAALAMANTFVATAAAAVSWMAVEWGTKGKPSLLGLASGAVAGLVAVTPAAGFAGPTGAMLLGFVVSPVCLFFCSAIKNRLGYDDSLDAFGIHCIGGVVGAIGTGLVVNPAWGGAGVVDYASCAADGDISTCETAAYVLGAQVLAQVKAVAVTLAWSGLGSAAVFYFVRFATGGRVSAEIEHAGLDLAEHGEAAYHA
jgi:Amt family ammonium transporter